MTKEKILEIIDKMPSDFDIEDLFERIIFMEKVDKGIEEIKEGKVISHESFVDITKQWGK